MLPQTEGYIAHNNGVFSYIYQYKDHLGNVRLSYGDSNNDGSINSSTEIIEENNYYPFGLKHKGYNSVTVLGNGNAQGQKYKFQGQERQDELLLGWDSFKYRNYDYAIGRFMNVDPLTEKYMDWSPYVFSGNRVVDCRELEGLEPIVARKGTQNLIIVNQGFAGEYPKGNSQAQNAGKSDSELGIDYSGLGKFTKLDNERTGTQVGVFASSQGDETKNDIASSIRSFKTQNKNGRVILVGHSLGADNLIEMVNENPSLKIDYMLTIDTADDYDDDNIPGNVKNIVNYYVMNGGVFGAAIGGEDVEIDDPTKTKGTNVPVISTHRKIDNDYIQNFLNRVITFLNQQSNEKKE